MNLEFVINDRLILVSLARAESMHPDEVRIVSQCSLPDDPHWPTDEPQTHSVHLSGVATGTVSLQPAFWRLWSRWPDGAHVANVAIPAGLGVGQTLTVDSATWYGGTGKPAADTGALGEWYADLSSGLVYKRCRGVLAKIAEERAQGFAALLDARREAEGLGLVALDVVIASRTNSRWAA